MDLKKWECPTCSKTFKNKHHFNRHVITHDPYAKVKCEICGKISKNPVVLASHMKTVHGSQTRPTCELCHKTFCNSYSLRGHMDSMHASVERPRFPCTFPACEKTYANQSNLSQHVSTEHAENPVRFRCALCGIETKCRSNLERHILTHTTEKTHTCATCGRRFPQMGGLRMHEMTHLDKSTRESFRCPLCPQTFHTGLILRGHIRHVHENQRNYACTFCDKSFSTSNKLNRHVNGVHPANKEKIHSCDKCEYRSNSKEYLACHQRRHDAKKHECYFCGEKFVTFSDLVIHCGRRHTLEIK
ncbi:gastrula zinc finger protein XlCGF46.1-like [Folsomia candida]|uniref:gastrula zinc finger protein XlCGF46.1-like n=1 Tax=Folsomia candida TaxID=158441 RepID=UPI001604E4F5|nr:gastrula zinc finger protein XlCGF46.1-like [Folsomia candida]